MVLLMERLVRGQIPAGASPGRQGCTLRSAPGADTCLRDENGGNVGGLWAFSAGSSR